MLTSRHVVKKSSEFYGIRLFVTVLTKTPPTDLILSPHHPVLFL